VTKAEKLAEIAARIEADKTLEIAREATHSVPGEGNPDAQVVFVGEAPGEKEDLSGQPFVGAAGKILAEMLAGIGLKREDVFITNTVKWRPPKNRDPLPEEIEACWDYLQEQLAVIDPPLIVTLGKHALERFLPGLRISQVHGEAKRRDGQVYLPLYHPAAALYNGSMRAQLNYDFQKIPLVLKKITSEASKT
jgi:DNA polymerase